MTCYVLTYVPKEHIVRAFTDRTVYPEKRNIVLEFAMYGNLSQQGLLTADELRIATLHVSRALNHVHAKNILHEDIKPTNILNFSKIPFLAKLCDFGMAADEVTKQYCGALQFSAPEVLQGTIPRKGRKSIPFSQVSSLEITVLMYALCSGFSPLQANPSSQEIYEWTKSKPLKTYRIRPGWEFLGDIANSTSLAA